MLSDKKSSDTETWLTADVKFIQHCSCNEFKGLCNTTHHVWIYISYDYALGIENSSVLARRDCINLFYLLTVNEMSILQMLFSITHEAFYKAIKNSIFNFILEHLLNFTVNVRSMQLETRSTRTSKVYTPGVIFLIFIFLNEIICHLSRTVGVRATHE